MGQSFSGFTATCNHDITYRFTCQKCGAGVGPMIHAFVGIAQVPEHGRHLALCDEDRQVLRDVGYIRVVTDLARAYRAASLRAKEAYSLNIFDNLCPHCGKFQDWTTVKGILRPKKVDKPSQRLYPVIDWRLEQLPEAMRAYFELAAGDEEKAAGEETRHLFEALMPGANAAIVQGALGETMYKASPFQSVRQNNAPDLTRGETALGYYVAFGLRWVVIHEGRVKRLV